jgi:hypothetical protein
VEFHYRGVDRDVRILRADGGIDATNAHPSVDAARAAFRDE